MSIHTYCSANIIKKCNLSAADFIVRVQQCAYPSVAHVAAYLIAYLWILTAEAGTVWWLSWRGVPPYPIVSLLAVFASLSGHVHIHEPLEFLSWLPQDHLLDDRCCLAAVAGCFQRSSTYVRVGLGFYFGNVFLRFIGWWKRTSLRCAVVGELLLGSAWSGDSNLLLGDVVEGVLWVVIRSYWWLV